MPEKNHAAPPLAGFEANLEELERIVKELESGDLPLEKALALFEQGVALSTACRKQLLEAQTRVEILLKKRNGEMEAEPFADSKE